MTGDELAHMRSHGLGHKLKARRESLGLTLRDVERAAKGRVSNAGLSQIENGHILNPSVFTLLAVAQVLQIDLPTLDSWLGALPIPELPRCPACHRPLPPAPEGES